MDKFRTLTVDDLYIPPFTAQKKYSEDGDEHWVPLERSLAPTGNPQADFVARLMAGGMTDLETIAKTIGCQTNDFYGWLRVTTGMSARLFRLQYIFRMADDLLRYTSMSIGEIARRTGSYSASALCQLYRKYRRCTPDDRRRAIRQHNDEGRFRL